MEEVIEILGRDYLSFRINENEFPFEVIRAKEYFKKVYNMDGDIVVVHPTYAEHGTATLKGNRTNEILVGTTTRKFLPKREKIFQEPDNTIKISKPIENKRGRPKKVMPAIINEIKKRGRPKGSKNKIIKVK